MPPSVAAESTAAGGARFRRGTGRRRRSFPRHQNEEIAMVDDKTMRAPQDAKLISLTEDYEVAYWTKKFGVRKERLVEAVNAVGDSAEKVGEYLKR
jgi:hypothetical protein